MSECPYCHDDKYCEACLANPDWNLDDEEGMTEEEVDSIFAGLRQAMEYANATQAGKEVSDIFDELQEQCGCPPQEDIVYTPEHYARWPIEPITFIMRNGFEFWRGNIVKYASRAGYKIYDGKNAVESEITDLEKVKRYCDMRINQLNGDTAL